MTDADDGTDTPDFDDMSDDELARTLETMREDMADLERTLQGEEEFAQVSSLIEQYAAENDTAAPVTEFVSWVDGTTDVDPDAIQGVLDAYLESVDADSLDETPVDALQSWISEQGGEGDGGDGDGEDDTPTMEDLQTVKDTLGEFADHMSDIKDMLQAAESEREEQIEELERRLQDVEDEPEPRSLARGKDTEFYDGDGEESETKHEDLFI